MMTYHILPLVICRTPAFAINQNLIDAWDELKSKIEESSPEFYRMISHLDSIERAELNEKMKFTLWKYHNRAQYRATPFGSFAALSTFPLHSEPKSPLILAKRFCRSHFTDWIEKINFHTPSYFTKDTLLLSNSSIYTLGDELRYIRHINEKFELATVKQFAELNFILDQCKKKTTVADIYILMGNTFKLKKKSIDQLIEQLLMLQLLITDNAPNITGNDYFQRLNIPTTQNASNYIISTRKYLNGGLNTNILKDLPELFNFLTTHLYHKPNGNLAEFRQSFLQKFEGNTVSLALAMDPEVGIGYGNLEQLDGEDELFLAIKNAKFKPQESSLSAYGDFQIFLLNQILAKKPIQLESYQTLAQKKPSRLPNTFSVMFQLYNNALLIESIGGCTANALLGRFTMACEQLEEQGRHIASLEAAANPDVIFFDIAYQVENHIDNVNRRKQLYDYELPILTYSTHTNPFTFDDILITVKGQEIFLSSKKLGKRLIPRIPSAYNYNRSDLAAYRFLCDLQHQNLITNLSFKLQDYFHGLSHYPRVTYKEIIVSAAMWLIPEQLYCKKNQEDELRNLKKWLAENKIDFHFKTGTSDHTLCFDPKNDNDLWALLTYCKQHTGKELYITEALISENDLVKDEKNNRYVGQYIINYYHANQIYYPIVFAEKENALTTNDIKLPGEDWLYFEIYSHPTRTNQLLLDLIHNFTKENAKFIKIWFFIRYTYPSSHLRFRMQLEVNAFSQVLMDKFQLMIKPMLLTGIVSDLQLKTYYRETKRYGIETIALVERFFAANSQFVLFLLKKSDQNDQLYANTLQFILKLCHRYSPDLNDQINFVKEMTKSFAEEMKVDASHFKQINSAYKELKTKINQLTIRAPTQINKNQEKIFQKIMVTCKDKVKQRRMLADLIHMHINRLFKVDQRVHEAVIYHYLLKLLEANRALNDLR